MEKFFTETGQGIVLNLHVIPGSRITCFGSFMPWKGAIRIKVRKTAVKGKANKEVLQLLKKMFNKEVELVAGLKSHDKKILVKVGES